jgi:hypothetical protein
VHHGAIAQQECERLDFIAPGRIDAEALGRLQYLPLQLWVDARIAVQNP